MQYIFEYEEEVKAKLETLQKRYNALNPRTENGKVRKDFVQLGKRIIEIFVRERTMNFSFPD